MRLTHRGTKIQLGLVADINVEIADRLEICRSRGTLLGSAVPLLGLL